VARRAVALLGRRASVTPPSAFPPASGSTHRLDDLDQLVDAAAAATRELDEILRPRDDGAFFRRADDRDSPAAAKLEQAFVPQLAQRPQDGVGVDLEDGGEVARRRETLAGVGLTVCDRPPDLGGDLLVELGGVLAIDLDNAHDATDTSTIAKELSRECCRPATANRCRRALAP